MLNKTPLLHQSLGPPFFLFHSFSLSLYFWLIPWSAKADCVTQGILTSFLLSLSYRRLQTTRLWSIKGPQQYCICYQDQLSDSIVKLGAIPLLVRVLCGLSWAILKEMDKLKAQRSHVKVDSKSNFNFPQCRSISISWTTEVKDS